MCGTCLCSCSPTYKARNDLVAGVSAMTILRIQIASNLLDERKMCRRLYVVISSFYIYIYIDTNSDALQSNNKYALPITNLFQSYSRVVRLSIIIENASCYNRRDCTLRRFFVSFSFNHFLKNKSSQKARRSVD